MLVLWKLRGPSGDVPRGWLESGNSITRSSFGQEKTVALKSNSVAFEAQTGIKEYEKFF